MNQGCAEHRQAALFSAEPLVSRLEWWEDHELAKVRDEEISVKAAEQANVRKEKEQALRAADEARQQAHQKNAAERNKYHIVVSVDGGIYTEWQVCFMLRLAVDIQGGPSALRSGSIAEVENISQSEATREHRRVRWLTHHGQGAFSIVRISSCAGAHLLLLVQKDEREVPSESHGGLHTPAAWVRRHAGFECIRFHL